MNVIICVSAALVLPMALFAQLPTPVSPKLSGAFPKPSFVLHDENLPPQKSGAFLGPMKSDGKGGTTGSIAFYGGPSLIHVLSLSFSSNGKLLAVGSTPSLIDIWDIEKRQKVQSFTGGVTVALSSDGRLLATAGNGLEVFDVSSGKLEIRIKWAGGTVQRLSIDPGDKLLLVSANGDDDKVFDLTNGQLLAELKNTQQGRFSRDGSLIIGGNFEHLITWNTQSWMPVRDLPNGPDYVTTIAADPERDLEVIGGPKTARLVKLSSGIEVAQVGVGYTNFAAFDRTGSHIFTYMSTGFGIWDTGGKQYCSQADLGNGTVALSPDDRWLAAAPVNQATDVMVWDVPAMLNACSANHAVIEH